MENWKNTAKLIRSLKDKKVRDEMGLFVVEGEKMVLEALESDFQVERVFISKEDCLSRIRQASEKGNPDCAVEMISTAMMEKISLLSSPSYCLALVRKKTGNFDWKGLCKKGVLALALDGVRDPGNIGTILRLSDWFGVDILFASDEMSRYPTSDIYNPKVVQATMGAIFRKKLIYANLPEVAAFFQENGMKVYGTFLDGSNIYQSDLEDKGLIVMGNESMGISPEIEECGPERLLIPPYPLDAISSESLNVATATAITLSEFRRRQG